MVGGIPVLKGEVVTLRSCGAKSSIGKEWGLCKGTDVVRVADRSGAEWLGLAGLALGKILLTNAKDWEHRQGVRGVDLRCLGHRLADRESGKSCSSEDGGAHID